MPKVVSTPIPFTRGPAVTTGPPPATPPERPVGGNLDLKGMEPCVANSRVPGGTKVETKVVLTLFYLFFYVVAVTDPTPDYPTVTTSPVKLVWSAPISMGVLAVVNIAM